jgi:hypothetical protein
MLVARVQHVRVSRAQFTSLKPCTLPPLVQPQRPVVLHSQPPQLLRVVVVG